MHDKFEIALRTPRRIYLFVIVRSSSFSFLTFWSLFFILSSISLWNYALSGTKFFFFVGEFNLWRHWGFWALVHCSLSLFLFHFLIFKSYGHENVDKEDSHGWKARLCCSTYSISPASTIRLNSRITLMIFYSPFFVRFQAIK